MEENGDNAGYFACSSADRRNRFFGRGRGKERKQITRLAKTMPPTLLLGFDKGIDHAGKIAHVLRITFGKPELRLLDLLLTNERTKARGEYPVNVDTITIRATDDYSLTTNTPT